MKVNPLAIPYVFLVNAVNPVFSRQDHWSLDQCSCKTKPSDQTNNSFQKYYYCLVSPVSFICLFLQLWFINLCVPLFFTVRRHVVPIAKCLGTLQPYKETHLFKLPIESLKSPLSSDITCTFKLF